MSTKSKPLNAEPSNPSDRKENDLAPKSYANAAGADDSSQQEEQPQQQRSQASKRKGPSQGKKVNGTKHTEHDKGSGQEEKQFKAPEKKSAQRNPVNGTKHSEQTDQEGPDGLDGTDDKKKVFEKHVNNNGEKITSVKPQDSFEESLKHNEEIAPQEENRLKPADSSLASGRQAGKGWERSAIRWAPLNVPLQRRLQTVAVLWHTLAMPLCLASFFFFCSIPIFWVVIIPYVIYVMVIDQSYSNGSLSRRYERVRKSKVWSLFASYYPARLHRTVELPPTRKYIFGYHPHGIISHGAWAAFATEALGFGELFPGITNTLLTLDSNFRVPFYREYLLSMGLASVSRESIQNILTRGGINKHGMGRAVTIVLGGARESLNAKPHTLRLVLKARKGFVKEAVRTGSDLVPVLAFGENDLYDQVDKESHPSIHKLQLMVKKVVGFTVPLFHARGVFNYDVGMMPYRRAINVVVGKPIKVNQSVGTEQQVDPEYVERLHAEYMEELQRLWESHKDDFARDRVSELEFVG